jgi:phosphohistidine phosphatase SixA
MPDQFTDENLEKLATATAVVSAATLGYMGAHKIQSAAQWWAGRETIADKILSSMGVRS